MAPIDVVEAREEVQRRREATIAAQRKVEYEQCLPSFWENGELVTPRPEWAPEFQGETPLPSEDDVADFKVEATEDRPEVRDLYIEAKLNNIELKLAKNNLLPKLSLEGGQRSEVSIGSEGSGTILALISACPCSIGPPGERASPYAEAQQQRLAYKQIYTEKQVAIDVDNWLGHRAGQRPRESCDRGVTLGENVGGRRTGSVSYGGNERALRQLARACGGRSSVRSPRASRLCRGSWGDALGERRLVQAAGRQRACQVW